MALPLTLLAPVLIYSLWLIGKVALITGGDSGIGKAVAIAFARDGADVVLSYLPEEEQDARDTARWIEKFGHRTVKLPGDLRDEAHCQGLVDRTINEFGKPRSAGQCRSRPDEPREAGGPYNDRVRPYL